MKIITNKDRTIQLPYQHDGAELLVWLHEHYPYSKYEVVEIKQEEYNEMV